MYLFEWGVQWGKRDSSYEERMQEARETHKKPGQSELCPPENVQESVSNNTKTNQSIYVYNETYIDVRTPNDEKRGVITLIGGSTGLMFLFGAASTAWFLVDDLLKTPISQLGWDFYVFSLTLSPAISFFALYMYIKYVFKYLRLEIFTARRIIVRFNRITRRVCLLRPKHLGGIRIMDWDRTQILLDKNMSQLEGTGGYLILIWDKGDGEDLAGKPNDDMEITFVGRPARNASELLAFWEYIRRYMEDGPAAAAPPEKLLSKFPWPWVSLKAAWGLDTSFLRNSGLWVFVLINLMLLPAILIHALGHWISLLLCYEPRFPKAIQEAGKCSTR